MTDEAGPDAKLITVIDKDPQREHIRDIDDLPRHLVDEIQHFFSIYKDLEPGKNSDPRFFRGRDDAIAELEACRQRFREQGGH